jgi:glycosyltransferase involved in cell wall biosynthesis
VRVLYVSDNRSDHNRRFLEKLSEAGHQISFLDITDNRREADWLPPGTSLVGLESVLARNSNPSEHLRLLPEFKQLVQQLKPDLVHAGPVQTCGYLAARAGIHPLLIMSWGSDLLMHINRNQAWQQPAETALRAADGFFCDCNAVRAAANRLVSFRDDQIVQFPWGIQPGSFSPYGPLPNGYSFEPGTIRVISTRAWEPLYDVDVLLEAFNLAYRRDPRLRLLLLGTGSLSDDVRQKLRMHSLNNVVTIPGQILRQDLPSWFRAADVYVSCAKSDGTSISLLEAMATGLPVVVTNNPSNREWVTEGRNGWLASESDAQCFADNLLIAARLGSQEREFISGKNQQLVLERADWDKNFPALLHLYERLVDVGSWATE